LSVVPVLDSLSREQWDKLLPKITYRDREVCRLRYGLHEGNYTYTLEECGRIFKVTRERIRGILQKAEIKAAKMFE
jgi:RNA polymerase primary sigma factor